MFLVNALVHVSVDPLQQKGQRYAWKRRKKLQHLQSHIVRSTSRADTLTVKKGGFRLQDIDATPSRNSKERVPDVSDRRAYYDRPGGVGTLRATTKETSEMSNVSAAATSATETETKTGGRIYLAPDCTYYLPGLCPLPLERIIVWSQRISRI